MYTKRNYGFGMTLNWSKMPFIYGSLYAAIICGIHYFTQFDLSFPWQPISVVGIAVAFYLGFKNNSSYDRTWEARKIWGGIVNSSRAFGASVIGFVRLVDKEEGHEIHRTLIYRHLAWLTALRYQLRLSREWEHIDERVNGKYVPNVCEAYFERIETELRDLLDHDELEDYKKNANMATQILARQVLEIKNLYDHSLIDGFSFLHLQKVVTSLYDEQGRSERIKNFPFPRQYASTTLWTTMVFAALVPFGLMSIFQHQDFGNIWLTVPFSGLIIWLFFLMEMIGDYSENPFEGTYNDVPITSISRAIEIDLREMLRETNIPEPIQSQNGFLM
jgi:putative membrane protein